MKKIYKYPLEITDEQLIQMPKGAFLRYVATQQGTLCLWAEIDTDNYTTTRLILIYGTGHSFNDNLHFEGDYIGSVQQADGALIWHLYDGGES